MMGRARGRTFSQKRNGVATPGVIIPAGLLELRAAVWTRIRLPWKAEQLTMPKLAALLVAATGLRMTVSVTLNWSQ